MFARLSKVLTKRVVTRHFMNPSHCCHVFHGCVPRVVVPSNALGVMGFCYLYHCVVVWCAQIIEYIMARFHLFAHCTTSLSSLGRCIWSYCTSKMFIRYILSSVCLRRSQFFDMELCVFSLPISLVMIVGKCVLHLTIITKSEVWTICHCLGLVMKQLYALYGFLYSYMVAM